MTKNYTKSVITSKNAQPSEKTIQFLLDYSKSLKGMKSSITDDTIELNLN